MSSTALPSDPRTLATPRVSHRAPLFLLGFLLALAAFSGVFILARAAANTAPGSISVVVAARDLSPREVISADAVTVRSLPALGLPPGYLARPADAVGSTALVQILAGETLSANLITKSPDQINEGTSPFLPIPQGDVAFTLPTSEQQGVAGYVAAGDYIDIVATMNTSVFGAAVPRVVTAVTFRHVHVIRVGPFGSSGGGGIASSLTVAVSECQAKVLNWLIANANLRYVLESYKDYGPPAPAASVACVADGVVGPGQIDAMFGLTKV